MSTVTEPETYFVFHPHVQLVRGRVGTAVHELFTRQLYWFREPAATRCLARLALGDSFSAVARSAGLDPDEFERYVEVLVRLGLGRRVNVRCVSELYRPLVLRSQAEDNSIYRDGGTVTVEVSGACLYDCPWCTSKTARTLAACTCGVWHDQGSPAPMAALADSIQQLSYTGLKVLVVRGGEPFLAAERLRALLAIAARLGLRAEIHTTGVLLNADFVSLLRDLPVHLVLLVAAREEKPFDSAVGRIGSWAGLQKGIATLTAAGVSFSAKVPVDLDQPEAGEATGVWARAIGATQVSALYYLTGFDGPPTGLSRRFGPSSPQDMAVTLTQFLTNGQSQFCYDKACFIALDGRVTPCIGQRAPLACLGETDMATILRTEMLSPPQNMARQHQPGCHACEFRFGCSACVVRTEQVTGSGASRHWVCRYDPEVGTWASRNGYPSSSTRGSMNSSLSSDECSD